MRIPSLPHVILSAALCFAASGCVATLGSEPECELRGDETTCSAYQLSMEELRASGAWVPDANALRGSNAWTMEYTDAPLWDPGRCSGDITPGGQAVRTDLRGRFPGISSIGGYSCRRNTHPSSRHKMSVHGTGRALDVMIPTIAGDADNTAGDAVAAWLMHNSRTVGIQLIIWDHTVWSPSRSAGNRVRRYTGDNPHVDHLHVELTSAGGAGRTPYFGGAPVAESTPVEPPPLVDHPPPARCGALGVGEVLDPGDAVSSCDGRFSLVHQTDGNLVHYGPSGALWSTGTHGSATAALVMQTDGNLVLYDRLFGPLFSTGSHGRPGAHLAIQDDGNVALFHGTAVVWSTGTVVGAGPPASPPPPPASPAPAPSSGRTGCGVLGSGATLAPGAAIASCDGRFTLVHQTDGNVALYGFGRALWSSLTHGQSTSILVMQEDGNLVLYSPEGVAVWDTHTHGHPGAALAVQDDANLVIYSPDAVPRWRR